MIAVHVLAFDAIPILRRTRTVKKAASTPRNASKINPSVTASPELVIWFEHKPWPREVTLPAAGRLPSPNPRSNLKPEANSGASGGHCG